MTADLDVTRVGPAVAARFVRWMETGEGADEVFAPDVFGDITLPHWRLQTDNAADLVEIRRTDHPFTGTIRVERLEPTPVGWVMQIEERWTDASGAPWYCREMFRADVTDGLISDFAIYCCGDWDLAAVRRHEAEVTLLRP
ncbi:hypothetical protein [Cryptosporangium sp. NPDC051539]|uniref:hypothetical protein n=1 Tax=Cryptosporangium sp. NPDC051539 TaxID=3363962 RepID=UPI0037A21B25